MADSARRRTISLMHILLAILLAGVFIYMAGIFWTIPIQRPGLENLVSDHLHRSGVTSPVTAVLLNFRGYDTLLEVIVLFLAVLGCWSLDKARLPALLIHTSPIQEALVRVLTPLMFIIATYMVWQGSDFAGGAFQGGAVLASIGVLLLLSNISWLNNIPIRPLRLGLMAGPLFFLLIASAQIEAERNFLQYPESWAGTLILLIEIFCALSIGLTLAALFGGGRPADDAPEEMMPFGEDD